jgi:integrase
MKRIRDVIPKSTHAEPFLELDSLFSRLIGMNSPEREKEFKIALRVFKQYLVETNNYLVEYDSSVPFEFEQHIHVYTVANFRDYLMDNFIGRKSVQTIYRYISFIQKLLFYAYDHQLAVVRVYKVPIFLSHRLTDAYAPYSKEEMETITEAIQKEVLYFNSLKITSDNYVKTGIGRDPRQQPTSSKDRARKRDSGYGWTLENTIYYFENMMNATPLRFIDENIKKHSSFFQIGLASYPGGLDKFYEDRGLLPYIGRNIIGLYILKLVLETGLNPESVINLKVDCFRKIHHMTGKPYLRYFKLRSKGEKDYTFFADEDENVSLEYLNGAAQSAIVEATISKILELTSHIRPAAKPEDQEFLFIFQSIGSNSFGSVGRFDRKKTSAYCNYLVTKYNLIDAKSQRLRLWLVRFRPTFISEMVKNGRNVFEILAMVGHKNIRTTLNYLYLRHLEKDFQFDIENALKTIHENRVLPDSSQGQPQVGTLYKGIIADCLDIFNPPELVKNAKGYDVNIPCNRIHLCMSCPNVVITKRHLSILYKYYMDIIASSAFRLGNLVHQISYERTVSIIESIFKGHSEFSKEELDEAKQTALKLPLLFIDSLVSPGYVATEEI